jgi:hypothetical protein
MIPYASLYVFLVISTASGLAGWAMVHFTSRVERQRQERHADKFGGQPSVSAQPSPWIRFKRMRRRPSQLPPRRKAGLHFSRYASVTTTHAATGACATRSTCQGRCEIVIAGGHCACSKHLVASHGHLANTAADGHVAAADSTAVWFFEAAECDARHVAGARQRSPGGALR